MEYVSDTVRVLIDDAIRMAINDGATWEEFNQVAEGRWRTYRILANEARQERAMNRPADSERGAM